MSPGEQLRPKAQSHAAERFWRVSAARRADARRDAVDRRRAALLACLANALCDAAPWPSRLNARELARERRGDGRARRRAARLAYFALCFVLAFEPAGGCGSFTPARRAFESPMAMACLVERAPCLPFRTCSISSRTVRTSLRRRRFSAAFRLSGASFGGFFRHQFLLLGIETCSMALEKLDGALVLLSGGSRSERAQIPSFPCSGIDFARVQPVTPPT